MEVPTYGDQKVSLNPLPNARITTEAPIAAFGGTVADAASRGVRGLAGEVADIADKERSKAIDTMTQDGLAKIIAEKNRLVFDPKDGALQKQGKDAFAVPEVYGKKFDDFAAQVENDMPDQQARMMFRKMRMNQRLELDGTLSRHVAQQADKLQEDTYNGLVATLTDDAVANFDQNPRKIAGNLRLMKAASDKYAQDKGLTGDDTKPLREEMWKQITNRLHVGVINRMVSMGETDAARTYFNANKAGISGMDMDSLEAQIRKTDVIKQKDNYLTAASLVDKAGKDADPAMVVPGFSTLSKEQRDALKRRFSNEQSPTANSEFYSLSPQEVASLDRADFETKYWSRFDAPHRKAAEAYWQSAIDAAKGSRAEVFKSIRGDKDMISDALRKTKLVAATGPLKDEDAAIEQRFTDYIDDQYKTFAHDNGRNPKDEEKQKIINRALLNKVFIDRTLMPDPEKPIGTLSEDELSKAYVPLQQIKTPDRLMLVNLARAQGIIKYPEAGGPNDARAVVLLQRQIEKAYAAAASGKATRADLISAMKGE